MHNIWIKTFISLPLISFVRLFCIYFLITIYFFHEHTSICLYTIKHTCTWYSCQELAETVKICDIAIATPVGHLHLVSCLYLFLKLRKKWWPNFEDEKKINCAAPIQSERIWCCYVSKIEPAERMTLLSWTQSIQSYINEIIQRRNTTSNRYS